MINFAAPALIPPFATNLSLIESVYFGATPIRPLPDCSQDPLRSLTICNTSACESSPSLAFIDRIKSSSYNSTLRASFISYQSVHTGRETQFYIFLYSWGWKIRSASLHSAAHHLLAARHLNINNIRYQTKHPMVLLQVQVSILMAVATILQLLSRSLS